MAAHGNHQVQNNFIPAAVAGSSSAVVALAGPSSGFAAVASPSSGVASVTAVAGTFSGVPAGASGSGDSTANGPPNGLNGPYVLPYPPGANLYIKYLDDCYDDEVLRQVFSPCGTIISARVMLFDNGQSKGFGFVCYTTAEEAANAIKAFNGKIILNMPKPYLKEPKPLYVDVFQPKAERAASLAARQRNRSCGTNGPANSPFPRSAGNWGPPALGPKPN